MNYYDQIISFLSALNHQWCLLQKKKYSAKQNPAHSFYSDCWWDQERFDKHHRYLSVEDVDDFDAITVCWSIIEHMQRLLEQPIDATKKLNIIRGTITCIKEQLPAQCAGMDDLEYKEVMSFLPRVMERLILETFYDPTLEAEETGSVRYLNESDDPQSSEQQSPHLNQEAVNTLPLHKAKKKIKPVLKQPNEFFLDFLYLDDAYGTAIFSATHEEKSRVAELLVSLFEKQAYSSTSVFQCNWEKSPLDYFFRKLLDYQTKLSPKILEEVAFIEVKGKKYKYSKTNASKFKSPKSEAGRYIRERIDELFSRYTWQPTL